MQSEKALSEATPVEIDEAWLSAMEPANRKFAAAVAASAKADRYRMSGGNWAASVATNEAQSKRLFEEYRAMRDEIEAPYMKEWEKRGGWTRAYSVPAGHIHKSTACHTLYPTTLITWVPSLSGHAEEEIVEYAGVHACTVCYPSAPVEALRAAERAEKAKGQCPGSGTWDHDSSGLRYSQRRARCNHCGQTVSCTSTGRMRAHKPKAKS